MRFRITVLVAVVAAAWILISLPGESTVVAGTRSSHQPVAAATPVVNDHEAYRSQPVGFALALVALREVTWTATTLPLAVEAQVVEDAKPEPKPKARVASVRRTARPIAPADIQALIEAYFNPEDVEWALRVSYCESHWNANAKNPRSSASGLFQHLATYWDKRSTNAGWAGADIFDPEANVAVAAYLYYHGGPGHWVCR